MKIFTLAIIAAVSLSANAFAQEDYSGNYQGAEVKNDGSRYYHIWQTKARIPKPRSTEIVEAKEDAPREDGASAGRILLFDNLETASGNF